MNIKGHSYYGPNLNHACIGLLITIACIYIYIYTHDSDDIDEIRVLKVSSSYTCSVLILFFYLVLWHEKFHITNF